MTTEALQAIVEDVAQQWQTVGKGKNGSVRFVVSDTKEVVKEVTKKQNKKETDAAIVEDIMRHLFNPNVTKDRRTEQWHARRRAVLSGEQALFVKCSDCKAYHRLQPNGELFWKAFEGSFTKEYLINRFQCPNCRPAVTAELQTKVTGAKASVVKSRNSDFVKRTKEVIVKMEALLELLGNNAANLACFSSPAPKVEVAENAWAPDATPMELARMSDKALSVRTPYGESLLHFVSAGSGDVEQNAARQVVLSRVATLVGVDARNAIGQTALHYAVRRGDLATVNTLVRLGADVTSKCGNGCSMLHYAVLSGRQSLVARFDEHFALNSEGKTPLDYSATTPYHAITATLLATHPDAPRAVGEAVACGNIGAVEVLVSGGAPYGGAELVDAVISGHASIVSSLLNKGVPVDSVDGKGRTPLIYACINGDEKVFDLIMGKKPNADIADVDGRTAVDFVRVQRMGRRLVGEEFTRKILSRARDANPLRRDVEPEDEEPHGALVADALVAADDEEMYAAYLEYILEEQAMFEATTVVE